MAKKHSSFNALFTSNDPKFDVRKWAKANGYKAVPSAPGLPAGTTTYVGPRTFTALTRATVKANREAFKASQKKEGK